MKKTTESSTTIVVVDKWTREGIGELPRATESDVEAALASSVAARREPWQPWERAIALSKTIDLLLQRREAMLKLMRRETGFTVVDVQDEFNRALVTLRLCAEEATRLGGEVVPLGASIGFESRIAFTIRVPIGVVLAITPFNAPLNTVCHKVGPALAGGNAVVLKPAQLTPLTAQALIDMLWEAGVPRDYLHVLHGSGQDVGLRLLRDSRVNFATFTGSTAVGLVVKRETGVRPVQLELGSVSATLVCEDANLDRVVADVQRAGFRKAGQVCTSVQTLYVHRSVHSLLLNRLASRVSELKAGDPAQATTQVGPLITAEAARRAKSLVDLALIDGATRTVGDEPHGSLYAPTLLDSVTPDMAVAREEIFAPVVSLIQFTDLDQVIDQMNSSVYGLQAGVYTASLAIALRAARGLEVGAVIVNGTSSTRADGMPYGGVKDSGFGREGPAYAIREMTIPRLVMLDA
jgi:succinate-semialdehyde dehydrogenase/glutarate-semialdehyde dehydrogenase